MELPGWAAQLLVYIGVFFLIFITVLRKIPDACHEAKKAVRAVRDLADEVRRPRQARLNESQSADD